MAGRQINRFSVRSRSKRVCSPSQWDLETYIQCVCTLASL